jgi:pimeloyl-ACP methyl ester carboxylesterase
MRIVLIPGWNEGADGMQVFVDGRHGHPGLRARGFACAVFDGGKGSLGERIDQLAEFLAGIRAVDSADESIGLFGYSAGGLIARGLLRKYPQVPVAGAFGLAAPNAGIVSDDAAGLLRRIHFSRSVIEDLDLESDFMRWLNGTSGHWEDDAQGIRTWKLDKRPWVGPEKVPVFNLVGRMPRYRNRGDGIVRIDSATLDGHMPHEFVDGNGANHLNLSGTWNPLTLVLRGWRRDDRLWPRAVERAGRFFAEIRP